MMWQTQTTIEYPFALRPASIEEAGLFYSQMDEAEDAVLGTVGHIRMDFGASGKEFYHTWWPHNGDQFNTGEFKDELQKFVDMLRADGPLTNLALMRNYCYQHGGMKKMFNKMSNTVKTMTCKAHCAMTCARAHLSAPLCNTRGEGYIDTAIKILIAVVLGALLLAGLYTLFGDTVLPTVTERVEEMFDYKG